MRRGLLIAAALLLPLMALAALLYAGTSIGPLTPWLEKRVGAALQRPVSFSAPPTVRIRRVIELEVQGLNVSDPDPGKPPLLTLGRGAITLRTASLFSATPVVERLTVKELAVVERIDENGRSNIPEFPAAESGPESTALESLPIDLRRADFEKIRFTRRDARDGKTLTLVAGSITQRGDTGKLMTVDGEGSLQGRPWRLALRVSSPEPLVALRDLQATLQGSIDTLNLDGELRLPSLEGLADAEIRAGIHGSLPREITELSPLLAPDTPIDIDLSARDALPGIDVELSVALPRVTVSGRGHIGNPRTFDDLDLGLRLSAPDANPLLLALGLPALEPMPLEAAGSLQRDGAALTVTDLQAHLGEHALSGSGSAPDFPSPDDARLDLEIAGPDFSRLQQLALLPVTLEKPYRAMLQLAQRDGPELLTSTLTVGEHRLTLSGPLGGLPALAGSDLRWKLSGPSVSPLLAALQLELPETPYESSGRLRAADDGRISLSDVLLNVYDMDATLSGSVRAYPDLSGLSAEVAISTDSLAVLTPRFGLKPFGDLPARASMRLSGDMSALEMSDLILDAGGLNVVQRSGALRVNADGLTSDLLLGVTLQEPGPLLGEYAWEGITQDTLRFDLAPRLEGDRMQLRVCDVAGAGAKGGAYIDIARDFSLDEGTRLNATLRVEAPASLLPPVNGLTVTNQPLDIEAALRWQDDRGHLDFQAESGTDGSFSGTLTLPTDTGDIVDLSLQGSSADLRQLVTHAALPDTALPVSLELQAAIGEKSSSINIDHLSLAGSELHGTLQLAHDGSELSGALQIPQAGLQSWLDHWSSMSDKDQVPASAGDPGGPLIPDIALPLQDLAARLIDLEVEGGDLGISDPLVPGASLVEAHSLTLSSNAERAQVTVRNLSGSRGRWEGDLVLGLPGDTPTHSLRLSATEVPLALVSKAKGLSSSPKHVLDARFSARGSGLRAVTASLDGELLLTSGPGELRDSGMRFATDSFFQQLLTTLLPVLKKSTDFQVECSALALQARGGVIAIDPGFILRSKRVDLSARGEIDLGRERLSVRFDNQARQGLGISAANLVNPYVQITGTLRNPRLGLDVANSVIAGGAAVATGGLSVFAKPLFGRFLRQDNPCKAVVEAWEARDSL